MSDREREMSGSELVPWADRIVEASDFALAAWSQDQLLPLGIRLQIKDEIDRRAGLYD